MHHILSVVALAASFSRLVSSQGLLGLPSCAEAPAIEGLGTTGCSTSNIACICSNKAFLTQLQSQVQTVCSASDAQQAIAIAQQLCAMSGVSLTTTAAAVAAMTTSVSSAVVAQIPTIATVSTIPTSLSSSASPSVVPDISSSGEDPTTVSMAGANATNSSISTSPVGTPFEGAAAGSFVVQKLSLTLLLGASAAFSML
ncbi:hypothetical protein MMC25_001078 [Agyrium rufum]|nr:hypothetical protein [Agyrium rufum]